MDLSYALVPFAAWLIAGGIKFVINSLKAKQLAFKMIGYGGLPSNHSAIVSSTATLIALREGVDHPAFSVAITLAFIVVLDASSLRRQVGKLAEVLNRHAIHLEDGYVPLRERMGHTRIEIAAGVVTGAVTAFALNAWLI